MAEAGRQAVPKGHSSATILPGVDSSFSQQEVGTERWLVKCRLL